MFYLNSHTYYSLRYGTFSEEDLCVLAKKKGAAIVGLTDINSSTACLKFSKIAPDYGIKPIVGIDFRNGNKKMYVGIAKNLKGFKNLNDFLSDHLHHKTDFPEQAPELKDCYFVYPFERIVELKKNHFRTHEFVGVSMKSIQKLKFSTFKINKEKLIFQQPVSLRNKKDYNAHRLLRAIDLNNVLSKLPPSEQADIYDKMFTPEEVKTAFTDFEFILENTEKLVRQCHVDFEFGSHLNKNLQVYLNSKSQDAKALKEQVKKNLQKRYPNPAFSTLRRVIKELQAIINLGFVSYFLINLDIINYAKSKNYPYIGRGSGANSVIAYILGITNVDPIELDLYFERFINPNRSSPPDFDLDFSWKDRDDITRYIFKRFPHTALMGTYVTFKRRAVARELGKVFGLPKTNIDKLSAGFFDYDQLDELEKLVIRYSHYIQGFPNYLSVHSGGILILNEPVHNFAATFLPPKNFATIQIDMHIAEEAGIHKFDILAQRGLPKITDAIEIIKENQPQAKLVPIDEINQFKEDININNLLKKGDCMGVFYVESPAMRGLLTKLQTDNYLNLVAASSIIRPGVASGGMKDEYIRRHRNPERRKQAHPILYRIMPDTYGVMVYQEDVMKVAHYFAGLGLDDADVLRRGMSGKKTAKGQMKQLEEKFRSNCEKLGYNQELIESVWNQIASFAGYAFPKGHSASYAVESYQSLYLKCYFLLEFIVDVLNNGGGFYNVETYLQEIRNCGGIVEAPDINKSEHASIIKGKTIYLGLGYLKELENKTIKRILENRNFFGPFQSLEDFIDRVRISLEQIRILIRIDAFRFTGKDKHNLLWRALFLLEKNKHHSHQEKLFAGKPTSFKLPAFKQSYLIDAYDQMELLSFHLMHPFRLLKHKIESTLKTADLIKNTGKSICMYGYLICINRIRTANNKYMYFGTFYDYEFKIFDTVHFPDIAQKYPVHGTGVYKCFGRVTEEFGHFSLQIHSIHKMEIKGDPRFVN